MIEPLAMRLPPELIDLILNELRGDISLLQTCSKAHPILSHLVEQYLYARIVIDTNDDLAVSELRGRLSKNPHILDYPRSLEIHTHIYNSHRLYLTKDLLSILSMMPRMPNLTLVRLCAENGLISYRGMEFLFAFWNCLKKTFVEEVYIRHFCISPLGVLDNCTNIKKLTLHDCLVKMEPIPNSPHQSLEMLIIRCYLDPELLTWASRRVSNLKSLQLRDIRTFPFWDWEGFPGLLSACSNSLTELRLDVGNHSQSTYHWNDVDGTGLWVQDHVTFPFTLSTHRCLKTLSVYALARSCPGFECALPAITSLIKTAPAVQDIDLHLHWKDSDLSSLGHFDWSRLALDPSDFPGIYPRIRLCNIQTREGHSTSREQMLSTLAENEVLMGLVRRNAVILDPCPDHSDVETPIDSRCQ